MESRIRKKLGLSNCLGADLAIDLAFIIINKEYSYLSSVPIWIMIYEMEKPPIILGFVS